MSTPAVKGNNGCTLCQRLGLRPLTKHNILYYYAPLQGLVAYGALSVNVLCPQLAGRLIPKRDVTNFLLVHTLLGTTLYVYNRPHLEGVDNKKRIVYSLLGGGLFSLGSVLSWAIIRSYLTRSECLGSIVGLATGYAIARLSYEYLKHVDSLVVVKRPAIE